MRNNFQNVMDINHYLKPSIIRKALNAAAILILAELFLLLFMRVSLEIVLVPIIANIDVLIYFIILFAVPAAALHRSSAPTLKNNRISLAVLFVIFILFNPLYPIQHAYNGTGIDVAALVVIYLTTAIALAYFARRPFLNSAAQN